MNSFYEDFDPTNFITSLLPQDTKIGHHCIIEEDVSIGKNVTIGNYVLLKKGTVIGDNCFIDSYVLSSGENKIGNNVQIRYQSIIARGTVIEDNCFLCAGVKTVYLDHNQGQVKGLRIKKDCFIGDNSVILGGVVVAENCVIGANSLVTRDTEPNGIYYGTPAKRGRDND